MTGFQPPTTNIIAWSPGKGQEEHGKKEQEEVTEEELRETYKRLIHQMVDAEDDVERLKEIYTFALYD